MMVFCNKTISKLKKIRHSVVTDDYSAIEQIQSQNWQYFVEYVLAACRANSIREKTDVKQAQLIKSSSENITICKMVYQSFYNQVEQNLNLTISNWTADEMSEINKGLQRGNYWANIETDDLLDCWSSFYFERGRFPVSQERIMVPQAEISKFVATYMPLSHIDLYDKFKRTDGKGLVSIQALAALNIHLGGNKIISKNTLTEILYNLTFQALSKENDDIYLRFDNIGLLVLDILECL